jgi:hypothetical protein
MIAALWGRSPHRRWCSRSAPCASGPSAWRMRRTWLRLTAMPSARAAAAKASGVHGAACWSSTAARVPSGWRRSRPGGSLATRAMTRPRSSSPSRRGRGRAGLVAQVVEAVLVEAVQPAVDRAWVAVELGGDLADLGAVPAQGDDRARSSQLAGAWRAAASRRMRRSSVGSAGGRANSGGGMTASCVTSHATHQESHPPTSNLRNEALSILSR